MTDEIEKKVARELLQLWHGQRDAYLWVAYTAGLSTRDTARLSRISRHVVETTFKVFKRDGDPGFVVHVVDAPPVATDAARAQGMPNPDPDPTGTPDEYQQVDFPHPGTDVYSDAPTRIVATFSVPASYPVDNATIEEILEMGIATADADAACQPDEERDRVAQDMYRKLAGREFNGKPIKPRKKS